MAKEEQREPTLPERLKDQLERLRDALEELMTPAPEPVPVRVPARGARRYR
jgi:hypothetical protein